MLGESNNLTNDLGETTGFNPNPDELNDGTNALSDNSRKIIADDNVAACDDNPYSSNYSEESARSLPYSEHTNKYISLWDWQTPTIDGITDGGE